MYYSNKTSIVSISTFLDEIIQLQDRLSYDCRSSYYLWYRGHADITWSLEPKIQRNFHGDDEELFRKERIYTNDFQARASLLNIDKPELNDFTNWLTLMQHYGLPTRLLDWSQSPLVALYFALSDKLYKNKDACVWILTPGLLNRIEQPEKPSVINGKEYENCFIYNMSHKTVFTMLYNAFRRWELSDETDAITPEDKKFDHRYNSLSNKIIACYPTEANGRVYNQHSTFTVHNSTRQLIDICDDRTLARITIPKENKEYLLHELKICGITENYIFPDFEHLANELMERYK